MALLKLDIPLDFDGTADHLRPICLPDSNLKIEGKLCTATGWGFKKFGKNNYFLYN